MWDDPPTRADLLAAWRDAKHAAELAERLAQAAVDAAHQADGRAQASAEIAELAEGAAAAADRAAERARAAASEAAHLARVLSDGVTPAGDAAAAARRTESTAALAYDGVDDVPPRSLTDGVGPPDIRKRPAPSRDGPRPEGRK